MTTDVCAAPQVLHLVRLTRIVRRQWHPNLEEEQ